MWARSCHSCAMPDPRVQSISALAALKIRVFNHYDSIQASWCATLGDSWRRVSCDVQRF